MHSRADRYRRLGIAAQQNAAQATDPSAKAAFEEVAANWFALAEQVGWLEKHGAPPQEESHECGKPDARRRAPPGVSTCGRLSIVPRPGFETLG